MKNLYEQKYNEISFVLGETVGKLHFLREVLETSDLSNEEIKQMIKKELELIENNAHKIIYDVRK